MTPRGEGTLDLVALVARLVNIELYSYRLCGAPQSYSPL